MTLSDVSNLAMVTATVLYVVAMLSHAVEWTSPLDRADGRRAVAGRIGVALTAVGWLSHLVGVVTRGVAAHRAPWGNMYEFVTSALLAVVAAHLVLQRRSRTRWLGLLVTLLASVGMGLAVTVFYVDVGPLLPALHSVWFIVHIVAAVVAAAAFNLGALTAIAQLLRIRAQEKGLQGPFRLPDPDVLDRQSFRWHAFAFPVWTFVIVAGSIWAQSAWGRFWNWDPKETWSLITWAVYAGYLHARVTAGWRGKRAAILALIGVAVFWFNFVGVNMLFSGLHSYGGK